MVASISRTSFMTTSPKAIQFGHVPHRGRVTLGRFMSALTRRCSEKILLDGVESREDSVGMLRMPDLLEDVAFVFTRGCNVINVRGSGRVTCSGVGSSFSGL